MDKLYWISCEEKGEPLFDGRFQGRTRGSAIKFLKERLGRPGLNGTVFTITEIPVPLIREIVLAVVKGEPITGGESSMPTERTPQHIQRRFDPYERPEPKVAEPAVQQKQSHDWKAVRRFYDKCRNVRQTAEHFGISVHTVRTRMRREGWK